MRKKNSIVEFKSERSECLLRNFREVISRQSKISVSKALQEAIDSPAPRFWVSEARATRIITQMFKGIDLTEGMNPLKRKMFQEIYRRVKLMKEQGDRRPVGDMVFDIVNSEAPSSYMSVDRASRIIR